MVRFIKGHRLASRAAAEMEATILRELRDLPYVLGYHGHLITPMACFLFTECGPMPGVYFFCALSKVHTCNGVSAQAADGPDDVGRV